MTLPLKITIVTISYNQARFLDEAITSVLEQNYPQIEYVIVDGGSTDGSIEIINRYSDRLHKVIVGPDDGPADALNKGFTQASGDILGFLNSDDTLLPGALKQVCEFMTDHPDCDFVSGHSLVTDSGGRVLRKTYSDTFNLRRMAHDGCILLQPATFFRRSLYQQTSGFNVTNRIAWDTELFLEFGYIGARHKLINAFMATYRIHEESITGSNSVESKRGAIRDKNLRRYLGRDLKSSDQLWRCYYRYLRKIFNLRDTIQRVIGGRIGGRYAK